MKGPKPRGGAWRLGHQEERERERRQGARRVREGTIPGDQPPDDSSQSLLNGNRERHLPTPGTRTIINCCSKLLILGGGLVDAAVDIWNRQVICRSGGPLKWRGQDRCKKKKMNEFMRISTPVSAGVLSNKPQELIPVELSIQAFWKESG